MVVRPAPKLRQAGMSTTSRVTDVRARTGRCDDSSGVGGCGEGVSANAVRMGNVRGGQGREGRGLADG